MDEFDRYLAWKSEYWIFFGGSLADKNPNYTILSGILLAAAFSLGIIPLLSILILPLLLKLTQDIRITAVRATLGLFTIPSILLGMVSPYVIRLKMHTVEKSGSVSGNIYAVSTMGSIVGTFSAGFFFIAYFGSTQIFYMLSFLLFCLSGLVFTKMKKRMLFLFTLFLCTVFVTEAIVQGMQIHSWADIDTNYNHVMIYDSKGTNSVRTMKIGNEYSSAMFLHSTDLVYDYTKYYRLIDHFNPKVQQALMLGGAGYSYPKDFIDKHPSAHLDVVEIDPQLTQLAKKYFRLKDSFQMSIYHEDGRTFLNRNIKTYDAICNDAFASYYSLPFQLSTQEVIKKMYKELSDNGVVITNIISSVDGVQGKFLQAEYATYASVFPHVYIFPVTNITDTSTVQNIMLIALKNKQTPSFIDANNELETYLRHRFENKIIGNTTVLTDNYAPVEQYAMELFAKNY